MFLMNCCSAFRTTTPEKLYSVLRRFADDKIDVSAMMDSWTRQSGYPLVTVNVHADRRNVSISQKRFFLKDKGNSTTKWDIPLNWATAWDNANFTRTNPQFILSKSADKPLELQLINKTEWIIFNVQQTGMNFDCVNTVRQFSQRTHNRFLSCELRRCDLETYWRCTKKITF